MELIGVWIVDGRWVGDKTCQLDSFLEMVCAVEFCLAQRQTFFV